MSADFQDDITVQYDDADHQSLVLTPTEQMVWSMERLVHLLKGVGRGPLAEQDREAVRLIRHLASSLRAAQAQNSAVERAREGL